MKQPRLLLILCIHLFFYMHLFPVYPSHTIYCILRPSVLFLLFYEEQGGCCTRVLYNDYGTTLDCQIREIITDKRDDLLSLFIYTTTLYTLLLLSSYSPYGLSLIDYHASGEVGQQNVYHTESYLLVMEKRMIPVIMNLN